MSDYAPLAAQPSQTIIKQTDDLFVHRTVVSMAGTMLPQHAHTWDHLSFIAAGEVRIWADGVLIGDVSAPEGITIKSGVKHMFMTLADGTIIDCIHRVDKIGLPDVVDEFTPFGKLGDKAI